MRLTTILHSIRRRWYVLLIGLIGTAVLCAVAFTHTHPLYQRNASELLVPGSQTVPKGGNPFLYLGGLDQASDVLVQALSATSVQGPLQREFPGTSVSISRDVSSTGPIVLLTVEGQNEGDVGDVFQRMLAAGPTTLESLQVQANVPEPARITMLAVDVDATSSANNKTRTEVAALVAVAGVVFSVLLVALIDGLLLASRRPRPNAEAEAAAAEQQEHGQASEPARRLPSSSAGQRITPGRVPRRARARSQPSTDHDSH
jgi:hypothetical protein